MTPPKLKQIIEFDLSILSEGAKQSNSCRFGIRDRKIGTYQYGGGRVHPRVMSPQGVVEAKVTWGDKGREVKKLEFWGDVMYR